MSKKNIYPENLESLVTPADFYRDITAPKEHDPNRFCYIVHGLNPGAKNRLLLFTLENGGYDPRQEIDLLQEPERVSEKKLISTSIINQDHTATWGDIFFILDVPWENFVSMSYRDCATNVNCPDFLTECARPPYTTPAKLIEQTKFDRGDSGYNEVVVTGSKEGKKVRIVGVGIKLTDVGEKVREPEEAPRMREIANLLGVPTIEITKYSRIEDSEAEVSYGYLSGGRPVRAVYLNRNSHRYCFEGSWKKTEITDVFKGDKNFYGGHNPVSKKEYLALRSHLVDKLSGENEQTFLKQLDAHFGLKIDYHNS